MRDSGVPISSAPVIRARSSEITAPPTVGDGLDAVDHHEGGADLVAEDGDPPVGRPDQPQQRAQRRGDVGRARVGGESAPAIAHTNKLGIAMSSTASNAPTIAVAEKALFGDRKRRNAVRPVPSLVAELA